MDALSDHDSQAWITNGDTSKFIHQSLKEVESKKQVKETEDTTKGTDEGTESKGGEWWTKTGKDGDRPRKDKAGEWCSRCSPARFASPSSAQKQTVCNLCRKLELVRGRFFSLLKKEYWHMIEEGCVYVYAYLLVPVVGEGRLLLIHAFLLLFVCC